PQEIVKFVGVDWSVDHVRRDPVNGAVLLLREIHADFAGCLFPFYSKDRKHPPKVNLGPVLSNCFPKSWPTPMCLIQQSGDGRFVRKQKWTGFFEIVSKRSLAEAVENPGHKRMSHIHLVDKHSKSRDFGVSK